MDVEVFLCGLVGYRGIFMSDGKVGINRDGLGRGWERD